MQDEIYEKIKSSPLQPLLHSVPTLNEWGAMAMAVVLGDNRIYGYKKKESNCLKSNDISI